MSICPHLVRQRYQRVDLCRRGRSMVSFRVLQLCFSVPSGKLQNKKRMIRKYITSTTASHHRHIKLPFPGALCIHDSVPITGLNEKNIHTKYVYLLCVNKWWVYAKIGSRKMDKVLTWFACQANTVQREHFWTFQNKIDEFWHFIDISATQYIASGKETIFRPNGTSFCRWNSRYTISNLNWGISMVKH